MIDRVVVATDGSVAAERAIDAGLDLASRFDAAVAALYVIDTEAVGGAPDDGRAAVREAFRASGENAVATVTDRARTTVETVTREGDPAAEIVAFAEDWDADVVAIGPRGRHGSHRLLLGSVAESVVRTCPCPVLSVRQLGEDETNGS